MATTAADNVTVLNAVGLAAGEALRRMPCASPRCADAVRACRRLPRCDTVEVLVTSTPKQRRALPKRFAAVLRASWARFGTHDPNLQPAVDKCAEWARHVRSGVAIAPAHKARFALQSCDEFAATVGQRLPPFGRGAPSVASAPPPPPHCPRASPRLVLATYQNGPSPWLCTFLRSLGYARVPNVVVLGWQPRAFARAHNVYYFTDRVYTTLRFLKGCGAAMGDGARFMFCDSDEMMQISNDELEQRVEQLLHETRARVIISAEARCMPSKLGKVAWDHSEAACRAGLVEPRLVRKGNGSALCMHKKVPRCLNTGNFVGRVKDVAQMLHQACRPCRREGLDIESVHRRYSRAYTTQLRGWVYSEQAELMELYLAAPNNATGWMLDFGQRLFHPNFWFAQGHDVLWEHGAGRLRNVHSQSDPAFVHYNGNSKSAWGKQLAASYLSAELRRRYVARTADGMLEQLDEWLREHVSFIGPELQRDTSVTFADVCSGGAI